MNSTDTKNPVLRKALLAFVTVLAALGISVAALIAFEQPADAEDIPAVSPTINEVDPFYVEFEWVGDSGNYFFDYRSGDLPIEVSVRTTGITSTDEIDLSLSDPQYEELFRYFNLEKGFVDDLFSFIIDLDGDYLGAIPDEPIDINVTAKGGNTQTLTMRFIES